MTQLTCSSLEALKSPTHVYAYGLKKNREHVNIAWNGILFFLEISMLEIIQRLSCWFYCIEKAAIFIQHFGRKLPGESNSTHVHQPNTFHSHHLEYILRLHRPISCIGSRPNLYAQWCLRTYKDVLHGAYPFAAIHSAQEKKTSIHGNPLCS